ncbi:Hypothetical protein IALB_2943 [Ignavibacterium album JCM 16511]|uniref:Glucosyl transferase n=1 Tax=Ignavibacterium album (strain DSM 19864 / JCM 16511 / NBRC 101810 / Mat9-16) TaxID=945713 RepID=I0ANT9_IGNAJ|nr:hypothetical protein [Ignavibacterium album]AFH50646.1 Hypothetical protein IALB_2943 [Ignavibacterium album JCM 16511]
MKPISLMPLIILLIQILLITTGCKQTTEPKLEPELKLELEDVSCTEAWINLRATNLQLPANVTLYKNSVAQNNILCYGDTLLYVDSLLPNQTYKFKSIVQSSNQQIITSSNELTVTTMDTTSHEFTWQSWEFGQHSSSTLYDVAIIDENNIWAVGEIYMLDSLGRPDPNAYNAVHWDGTKWELKKIGGIGGWACHTVFAFSSNDIWFEGNIHWNGSTYTAYMNGWPLMPNGDGWQVNKMWGSSSSDLYAVGNNGNIAHYQNGSWTKIESGTTSILNDVWGIKNELNRTIVYCAASSFFVPGDKKILKITDAKVDSVNWNRDVRLYSAWTNNDNFLYVCGEGVFVNKFRTWSEINLQQVGTNSIRGNKLNDIFIAGDYGFKSHFNGLTWQVYNNNYLKGYSRLSFQGNIVAIAGNYQGKATVEIGRRN